MNKPVAVFSQPLAKPDNRGRGEGEEGEEEEEEGGKEGGDLERRDKFSQQTACNTPSASERPTLKLTRLRDGNPRYRKH